MRHKAFGEVFRNFGCRLAFEEIAGESGDVRQRLVFVVEVVGPTIINMGFEVAARNRGKIMLRIEVVRVLAADEHACP